jgi:putative (di)nucleoside polyphosphate hydrolase
MDADAGAELTSGYRRGVGIMLLNQRNEVFVGQRADTQGDAWQMPQGGIDGDEEPRAAALRELREEIGTDKAQIIAESKTWLRYELPLELRKRWNERWQGQQQKSFVTRFQGSDADINIATEHPEFSAWKWVALNGCPTSSSRSSASSISTSWWNYRTPRLQAPRPPGLLTHKRADLFVVDSMA